MIVLHGGWCPLPHARHGGAFMLWAETAVPHGARARPGSRSLPAHPGQVSARQVRVAWRRLAAGVALPSVASRAVIWLPSAGGRPLASPELELQAGAAEGGHGRVTLGAWGIAGLALAPAQALRLLAVLPETAAEGWSEMVLGSDLRFWSQAAKLALELLARQRYLPALVTDRPGVHRAAWLPSFAEPGDAERLHRLARGMPPVCRALRLTPANPHRTRPTPAGLPSGQDLLESFIASTVDQAVRLWAPGGRRRTAPAELALQWLQLLLERRSTPDGRPPALEATPRTLRAFHERYQSWVAQTPAAGDGGFRVCLRLEPPETEGDGGRWVLRYFLQATDDPSLLVPAETVWREATSTLHYLNRRFEGPQERLLGALGRASRLFPPLERSLQAARPEACALSTGEAYAFLREAAPLLESAGFGLLVPPWWGRPQRVGLRLRASPKDQDPARAGLFSLESLVRYDWELSLGDRTLSQEEFRRLAELKEPLVRVRGQWVELRPEQVERILSFWSEERRQQEGTLLEVLRLAQTAAEAEGQEPLPVVEVSASGWIDAFLAQLSGRQALRVLPQPTGFQGELRPYQVTGVSWLAFLRRWGLGACLADDMGLGKTIQVLALLLHDGHGDARRGPSLLVCPTSAVGNWQREAARFAPDLRVLVHHGLARQSGAEFAAEAARHDLVISTYSLLYRDEETLSGVEWDGIILDEAQNIKNPASRQAQAARALRGRFRVALTGTPVENRLGELWSIMHFLNRGYLGSEAEFRRRFALPIERYQDPAALRRLKSLVRPFLLRRLKSDPEVIRDLPDKMEMPVYCHLTAEQATLYQAVVNDSLRAIAEAEGIERRGRVLAMLTRLKQICDHPALFLGDGSSLAGRSGKLARLTEMLEEVVAAGERALVFTQFAAMGQLLRTHLQGELYREVLFLHGGVPQPQRDRMVARFQEDPQGPQVFILSLRAGGTALNLMRANHVFHFDRWWNPAVENQATDRAYRIGQTRDVQVRKFTCLGTLEERIEELIDSKKALAQNVVEAGEGWLTELSTDELRDLLTLRAEAVSEG